MKAHTLKATLVMLVVAGSVAVAQQPTGRAPAPAGPRTIVGVVTDTSNDLFVDSVQISVVALRRRTTTAANGTFRFDDVNPGKYEIQARRFGYQSQIRTVTVGSGGGAVRFTLLPFIQTLPTAVTTSTRRGLSGVIGDTTYRVLHGAEVWAVATDRRATTDSLGQFHVDLRPGKYIVRISRPGYSAKVISVLIPSDSGRRVVATLAPWSAANNKEVMMLQAMSLRLAQAVSARSKLYTREELAEMGSDDLQQIATRASVQRVDEGCPAVIDGGPQTMPLWLLSAADLETVEVYLEKPPRRTVGVNRAPAMPDRRTDVRCAVTVYAWLRK